MVPAEGLEPTRSCDHWILSPARLPFRHAGVLEGAKEYGLRREAQLANAFAVKNFPPNRAAACCVAVRKFRAE